MSLDVAEKNLTGQADSEIKLGSDIGLSTLPDTGSSLSLVTRYERLRGRAARGGREPTLLAAHRRRLQAPIHAAQPVPQPAQLPRATSERSALGEIEERRRLGRRARAPRDVAAFAAGGDAPRSPRLPRGQNAPLWPGALPREASPGARPGGVARPLFPKDSPSPPLPLSSFPLPHPFRPLPDLAYSFACLHVCRTKAWRWRACCRSRSGCVPHHPRQAPASTRPTPRGPGVVQLRFHVLCNRGDCW